MTCPSTKKLFVVVTGGSTKTRGIVSGKSVQSVRGAKLLRLGTKNNHA